MNKNEMTAAMFEEIKEKMSLMGEKLDDITFNQQQVSALIQEDVEQRKTKTIKIENVINYLLQSIDKSLRESTGELSKENSQIISKMDKQADSINSFSIQFKKSLKKRKIHSLKIYVFQVLFLVAATFSFYLVYENQNLKESELKYEYLKAKKLVMPDVSGRLDTVFDIKRNEEMIDEIERVVHAYNNN